MATALRQRQTPVEARLWTKLRNRRLHGYKFRRQHPIGRFIVDFICIERRLIVELDGSMHTLRAEADRMRDQELEAKGFLVLRIGNESFRTSQDFCMEKILAGLLRELD